MRQDSLGTPGCVGQPHVGATVVKTQYKSWQISDLRWTGLYRKCARIECFEYIGFSF